MKQQSADNNDSDDEHGNRCEPETDLVIGSVSDEQLEQSDESQRGLLHHGPVIELELQGQEQPVSNGGLLGQVLRPVSITERLSHEIHKCHAWLTVTLALVAGILYQHSWSKMAATLLAVSYLGYRNYDNNERDKNVQRFVNMMKEANRDNGQKFVRQVNGLQRMPTEDSDGEPRSEWINDLITKIWPHLNGLIQQVIDEKGLNDKGAHREHQAIFIERFSLGDKAPSITQLTVNKSSDRQDEILVDLKLSYQGNCLVSVSRRPHLLSLPIGIRDVTMQSNCRLILRPLMTAVPFVGGLVFSFLETPEINFEGIDVTGIADSSLVRILMMKALTMLAVEPNRFYFLLAHDHQIKRMLVHPKPVAICIFQIYGAHDLPAKSRHDPFCLIRVGGVYFKTEISKSSANPEWHEHKLRWCAVHDFNDAFRIELYGSHFFTPDDFIGSVEFKVRSICDPGINGLDKWLPLSGSSVGSLHFKVACFQLSTNPSQLIKAEDQAKRAKIRIPVGMINVFIHSIRPAMLFETKDHLAISPFLLIKCTNESFVTEPLPPGGNSHKIDQHCSLKCDDPVTDVFQIIAIDKNKLKPQKIRENGGNNLNNDDVLSHKAFLISDIASRPDMIFESELILDGGVKYAVKVCIELFTCSFPEKAITNLQRPLTSNKDVAKKVTS
ncbi:Extended synaptotagmin-3 [Halotydeus destructor]|nr:Extended synaptotagmin-3 [Halotydeus destructor]